MNIQEKRKRLQELLEKNIRHEEIGTAIAITGSWGVGKTYFWNEFLKEVTKKEIYDKNNFYYEASRVGYKSIFDNRKYAYISLFGIEHLSDLKNAICTKLSLNPYAKSETSRLEFSQLLKNTVAQFKDVKVSQYGVSASAKILEALLFLQVKDAIICFDDFERMSNKLDIKDIMGLANQLKLEKNCQVILILDESKAEGENKSKYAEYKEKLIDEEIKITSVEPLIRENATEFDQQLIELMVEFADESEIHNFRFFQKVIKLYNKFRSELPEEVAYSTKEIILIRILQGYFIADFGLIYNLSWSDFTFKNVVRREISKKYDTNLTKKENIELAKFKKISYSFVKDDLWLIQFKNWFEQKDTVDILVLNRLAKSDLINAEHNTIQNEFWILCNEIWNYQCDESFPERFFKSSLENIGLQNLGNLSFAITILEKLGAIGQAKELEERIKDWIEIKLSEDRKTFRGINSFGQEKHSFNDFIDKYLTDNSTQGLPSLSDSIYAYHIHQQYSEEHEIILNRATKDDWSYFIFKEFNQDKRFVNVTVASIVSKISSAQKALITEILVEKGKNSEFNKRYMDYLISKLDE